MHKRVYIYIYIYICIHISRFPGSLSFQFFFGCSLWIPSGAKLQRGGLSRALCLWMSRLRRLDASHFESDLNPGKFMAILGPFFENIKNKDVRLESFRMVILKKSLLWLTSVDLVRGVRDDIGTLVSKNVPVFHICPRRSMVRYFSLLLSLVWQFPWRYPMFLKNFEMFNSLNGLFWFLVTGGR